MAQHAGAGQLDAEAVERGPRMPGSATEIWKQIWIRVTDEGVVGGGKERPVAIDPLGELLA